MEGPQGMSPEARQALQSLFDAWFSTKARLLCYTIEDCDSEELDLLNAEEEMRQRLLDAGLRVDRPYYATRLMKLRRKRAVLAAELDAPEVL